MKKMWQILVEQLASVSQRRGKNHTKLKTFSQAHTQTSPHIYILFPPVLSFTFFFFCLKTHQT